MVGSLFDFSRGWTPFLGFLGGLGLALVLAYPIFQLLGRMKARQVVSKHLELHQVKAGTPTMGGMIFVSAFVPIATISGVDLGIVIPFFLYSVLGFLDDYVVPKLRPGSRGLEWKPKLLGQFGVAMLYSVLSGHVTLQSPDLIRLAFDILCVVYFANAFNFTDGLDGLAFSVGMMLFPGLAGIAICTNNPSFVLPLAILAGAMLPFGYLNAPKARLFMGDTGSMPIGALVGMTVSALAWRSSGEPMVLGSLVLVTFMMHAELIPVPMQIFWVKVFKKRLFPMTPIHHAFEKAGWREVKIVLTFAGVQAACSLIAVLLVRGLH